MLFRSVAERVHHWALAADHDRRQQIERDGFGAKSSSRSGSNRYAEVRAGSSFEVRATRASISAWGGDKSDSIVIAGPSGKVEKLGPESADQELVVQEGRVVS